MARARNIKPGVFKNELLVERDFSVRLLFIGLWTLADREGRVENRPKRIKIELFPDDDVDVAAMVSELEEDGFVYMYEASGRKVIQIVNFLKHQTPHGTEKDSELPDQNGDYTVHERTDKGCVIGWKRDNSGIKRADNVNLTLGERDTSVRPEVVNAAPIVSKRPDILNPDLLNPDSLKEQGAKSPLEEKKTQTATASRLPADWLPSADDVEFCKKERPDLICTSVAEGFRDYWIAQPGAKGRKADWSATWRNWVRNEKRQQVQPQHRMTPAQINSEATTRAIFGSMLPSATTPNERVVTGEVLP